MKSNSINITDQLIDDLYNMSQAAIPVSVLQNAKHCLLDYIGVTLAGVVMLNGQGDQLLNNLGSGTGAASVIGLQRKAATHDAALINGFHAHVAELDDGERFGMFHPGAPIISALLPVAEQHSLSGRDLLTGIIVGYEAAIRMAGALQPAMKEKGYHGTGTFGTIGAAVGIAAALRFSKPQMKDALSAAVTSASGILKVIKDVSQLKPYNVGQAAQGAVTAAMLPLAGFKGPLDVLGGKLGFLSMMSDNVNLDRLAKREDGQYGIQRVYRKPYAACRHCHSPIEASLLLREQHNLKIRDIQSIRVDTHFWAVGGHDHTEITGINSAKMSIPYSVAAALATGKAGLNEFTEASIADEAIIGLTQKITVASDDALTKLVPNKRAAIVEVETTNGKRVMERVDLPKGEPETAMTDAELMDKFVSLAEYAGMDQEHIANVVDVVWNIETKLGDLYTILQ